MTVDGSCRAVSPSRATSRAAVPIAAPIAATATTHETRPRLMPMLPQTRGTSTARLLGAQAAAEERQHVILEPIGNAAGVRARVDLERVGDAVAIEHVVELARVDAQAVLIADVDGDG